MVVIVERVVQRMMRRGVVSWEWVWWIRARARVRQMIEITIRIRESVVVVENMILTLNRAWVCDECKLIDLGKGEVGNDLMNSIFRYVMMMCVKNSMIVLLFLLLVLLVHGESEVCEKVTWLFRFD
jgi:hypothetical protein